MKRADEFPQMRLTRQEREHDEQILAAILSAPHTAFSERYEDEPAKRVVIAAGYGVCGYEASCAVGAGLLYRGLSRRDILATDAATVFAAQYGVDVAYAIGVSDGFETGSDGQVECRLDSQLSRMHRESRSYRRGVAVGAAVAAEIGDQARP